MLEPPLSADEPFRLAAVRATGQLCTPIEERFELITRMACRLLDVPIAAVSMIEADHQWFKSIQGLDVESTCRDVSFCGHTILQSEIFLVPDARLDSRFADNPLVTAPPHIVFYAGCPIRSSCGSNIATLCLIDTRPRQLANEEQQTLRDLAEMAEHQFELTAQHSLQTELRNQIQVERRNALIDPLTRLWNRRGIERLFEGSVHASHVLNQSMPLILADLDHFKSINDRYGHPVGDEVLREVSKRLLGAARTVDHVGRYGGEEFLVLLADGTDPAAASDVAERLRQAICERPINTGAGNLDVTASFGLHDAPPRLPPATAAEMIGCADAALYAAKSAGRNQVCRSSRTG